MSLHTQLPIHRDASSLLGIGIQIQVNLPRAVKRALGDKIIDHCVEMLDLVARANACKGERRARFIELLLEMQRAVQHLLRVAFNEHFVSPKLWGAATQKLEAIGRQAGGWLKSTREQVPAA